MNSLAVAEAYLSNQLHLLGYLGFKQPKILINLNLKHISEDLQGEISYTEFLNQGKKVLSLRDMRVGWVLIYHRIGRLTCQVGPSSK